MVRALVANIDSERFEELVGQLTERAAAALGLECSAEVVNHQRAGTLAVVSVRGGSSAVSVLWRWFDGEREGQPFRPVVLTDEAWMMADEFAQADYDTVIAEADEVDPSGHLQRRALMFAGVDSLEEVEFSDSSGQGPATIENQNIAADVAGSDPTLYLFPVDASWKIVALMELGADKAHEHLAILRHFELNYGARLAATNSAVTLLALTAPITDISLARTAAIERIGYADTTSGAREYEPEEVLAATVSDTVWGFWFD
jgi:hypothetical protein